MHGHERDVGARGNLEGAALELVHRIERRPRALGKDQHRVTLGDPVEAGLDDIAGATGSARPCPLDVRRAPEQRPDDPATHVRRLHHAADSIIRREERDDIDQSRVVRHQHVRSVRGRRVQTTPIDVDQPEAPHQMAEEPEEPADDPLTVPLHARDVSAGGELHQGNPDPGDDDRAAPKDDEGQTAQPDHQRLERPHQTNR